MLFFPFSTHLFSVGAWAYAGQTGRFTDAGAYFSGLGFVWDGVFVVWGLLSWRGLTRRYFRETVSKADPFWAWAGRYLPETALLALYRASFFYGICRWTAWLIWAHVVKAFAFDLTWGGPHWVPAVHSSQLNALGCSCPCCRATSPRVAMYAAIAVTARLKGACGSARELLHESPLVRAEPRWRAGARVLARVVGARGGRDRDVDARVGEGPLEERLSPALDPEGLE